jgi:calcineurin-like phosphoesterase family protein
MSKYYISDLHLGHYNAMSRFDHRPFKTLDEMDKKIIQNINQVVTPQDELYLLGEVSWYKPDKTAELIKSINCKNRFLIVGNHDSWVKNGYCKKLFQGVYDLKRVDDKGRIVVLCHYPIAVWDQSHRGSYHLYGHVHSNINEDGNVTHNILEQPEMKNAFNVGCMLPYMDYTPRTLDFIIKHYKNN